MPNFVGNVLCNSMNMIHGVVTVVLANVFVGRLALKF